MCVLVQQSLFTSMLSRIFSCGVFLLFFMIQFAYTVFLIFKYFATTNIFIPISFLIFFFFFVLFLLYFIIIFFCSISCYLILLFALFFHVVIFSPSTSSFLLLCRYFYFLHPVSTQSLEHLLTTANSLAALAECTCLLKISFSANLNIVPCISKFAS